MSDNILICGPCLYVTCLNQKSICEAINHYHSWGTFIVKKTNDLSIMSFHLCSCSAIMLIAVYFISVVLYFVEKYDFFQHGHPPVSGYSQQRMNSINVLQQFCMYLAYIYSHFLKTCLWAPT